MIGKLISALMNLIIILINLLLAQIDLLIEKALPDVNNLLNYINSLFSYINGVIGYAVDASCLSDIAIGFIVAYWVFALTLPLGVGSVKLAIKWYNALKF